MKQTLICSNLQVHEIWTQVTSPLSENVLNDVAKLK